MPYVEDCSGGGLGGGGGCGGSSGGSTDSFTGSVGTALANIPATDGNLISVVTIRCKIDQGVNTRLEFSFDEGTNWFRLKVGETYTYTPIDKRHISLKASGSGITTANYEVMMNRGIS